MGVHLVDVARGLIKMYIKGRPVVLYAPSDVASYDITKPNKPPKQTLQLEWVYPLNLKKLSNLTLM